MNSLFGSTSEAITGTSLTLQKVMGKKIPWCELYKPSKLSDVILPGNVYNQLNFAMNSSGLKSMTFHSGPGTGKTTVAKLIPKELGSQCKFYNASQLKIDTIRDEIEPYGSQHVIGSPRIIILDECDRATSKDFWDALRNAIDKTIDSVRYLLTGNFIYNIPEPILSRCTPISFAHNDPKIKIPIFEKLKLIAKTECTKSGGTYDIETLKIIAKTCYPDIRRMINVMELTYDENQGSIIGTPVIGSGNHLEEIFKYISSGCDLEARGYFNENVTDYNTFFPEFCDFVQTQCTKVQRIDVGLIFAEYQYRAAHEVNQELNITRGLFGQLIKMFGYTNVK